MTRRLLGTLTILLIAAGCSGGGDQGAAARDHILVAGSSTVHPFAKAVAAKSQPTAKVEATGTGTGIERFCSGTGGEAPDVVGASRRMNASEFQACQRNGVTEIVELQIGKDGVVFAHSPAAAPITLTQQQIYRGLAANPFGQPQNARSWKQVDAALPDVPISVYGPPASSGTRDSLVELIMLPACESNPEMRQLKTQDEARFNQVCGTIRTDGVYTETTEDDERTSMQLVVNPRAIGVFGYSYLEKQGERLRAIAVDGVTPAADTIGSGSYLASRPLYLYVKKSQVEAQAGLREYLAEFVRAIAPGAYLAEAGLIPAPDPVRQETTNAANGLTVLRASSLR